MPRSTHSRTRSTIPAIRDSAEARGAAPPASPSSPHGLGSPGVHQADLSTVGVDVGEPELFPSEVERLFVDTYDTLVRITEEVDLARDLLAGVRDHLQSKIAENQNEVGKKLTVIASLVLVPSFIVGFYGQNFEGVFHREYWALGVSVGLIVVSTLMQLALFRWRRWI